MLTHEGTVVVVVVVDDDDVTNTGECIRWLVNSPLNGIVYFIVLEERYDVCSRIARIDNKRRAVPRIIACEDIVG